VLDWTSFDYCCHFAYRALHRGGIDWHRTLWRDLWTALPMAAGSDDRFGASKIRVSSLWLPHEAKIEREQEEDEMDDRADTDNPGCFDETCSQQRHRNRRRDGFSQIFGRRIFCVFGHFVGA
jgi:hypothetical protein